MIPYFVVLIAVVVIAYVGRIANDRLLRWFSLGSIALILIGFAGLRDRLVGLDTGNYVRGFQRADTVSFITRTTEIGYNSLVWLARSASDSYAVLLTLIAAIVVGCYLWTSVRLVKRYEMALFIFITLGVYTFFFNGARQGIAAAICFAALPFLLERRALPYVLTVGVAALFHHSALVALPLYYAASPQLDVRRLLAMAVVVGALVASLDVFVQLAAELVDEKYATYSQQREGGGRVASAFYVSQGLVLLMLRNRMGPDRELYTRLLNIYLVGLVPVLASVVWSVNPSGVLRLRMYFAPVVIVMWPMILLKFGDKMERVLIGFAFVAFLIIYFGMTTSAFSNLVPYRINQEILSW